MRDRGFPGWGAFRVGGGIVRQDLQDRSDSVPRFRMKRGKAPSSPAADLKNRRHPGGLFGACFFLSLPTNAKFIQKLRPVLLSNIFQWLAKTGALTYLSEKSIDQRHGPGAFQVPWNIRRPAREATRGSRNTLTAATTSSKTSGASASLAFLMNPRH